MRIHLINPSEVSFGIAVITPRWLYVLAAATPAKFGDPCLVDETLVQVDSEQIQAGDVVGIGIHTANAYRGRMGLESGQPPSPVASGGDRSRGGQYLPASPSVIRRGGPVPAVSSGP